jgi:hypothetical protein
VILDPVAVPPFLRVVDTADIVRDAMFQQ